MVRTFNSLARSSPWAALPSPSLPSPPARVTTHLFGLSWEREEQEKEQTRDLAWPVAAGTGLGVPGGNISST